MFFLFTGRPRKPRPQVADASTKPSATLVVATKLPESSQPSGVQTEKKVRKYKYTNDSASAPRAGAVVYLSHPTKKRKPPRSANYPSRSIAAYTRWFTNVLKPPHGVLKNANGSMVRVPLDVGCFMDPQERTQFMSLALTETLDGLFEAMKQFSSHSTFCRVVSPESSVLYINKNEEPLAATEDPSAKFTAAGDDDMEDVWEVRPQAGTASVAGERLQQDEETTEEMSNVYCEQDFDGRTEPHISMIPMM